MRDLRTLINDVQDQTKTLRGDVSGLQTKVDDVGKKVQETQGVMFDSKLPKCPQGHKCSEKMGTSSGFSCHYCDKCKSKIGSAMNPFDKFYRCDSCDYDLCEKCYKTSK